MRAGTDWPSTEHMREQHQRSTGGGAGGAGGGSISGASDMRQTSVDNVFTPDVSCATADECTYRSKWRRGMFPFSIKIEFFNATNSQPCPLLSKLKRTMLRLQRRAVINHRKGRRHRRRPVGVICTRPSIYCVFSINSRNGNTRAHKCWSCSKARQFSSAHCA